MIRRLPGKIALVATLGLVTLLSANSVPGAQAAGHATRVPAAMLIKSGYLTVGSDTSYPPMESRDPESLKFVGADVDLANALAHAMGLKGAIIVSNIFDTLIPVMLSRHKFDVIMSSMNDRADRRKLGVRFVDYLRASEAILVKKTSSVHANNYSGICGQSISVERGTTEQDGITAANKKCKSKINVKLFATDSDAYNAFASGHVNLYSSDYPVIVQYVHQHSGQYRTAGNAFGATEDYGIAIPKSNTALFNAVKRALAKIKANGQYKQILKKWNVQGAAL
jgi:polar amino acid transport system substrate-binding protein